MRSTLLIVLLAALALAVCAETDFMSAVAEAGGDCHPECRWQCDDPVCPAVCHPVCERPKCQIHCEEVTAHTHTVERNTGDHGRAAATRSSHWHSSRHAAR